MAASALSNSLLSSPPPPPPPHRPTFAWSPSRSQVNLRSTTFRSYPTLFTTRSSLDAANDTKQDTPIELSMYFASKTSFFLILLLLIGLVSFLLQDMLHFPQWWISTRFVKFCLTGLFYLFFCDIFFFLIFSSVHFKSLFEKNPFCNLLYCIIFLKFSVLCTSKNWLRKTHVANCNTYIEVFFFLWS